jgi:hypothetical protein
VKKQLGTENTYGEMINTILLTKSGAKDYHHTSVRYIMEPHYNNADESGKGSRRLKSHMDFQSPTELLKRLHM